MIQNATPDPSCEYLPVWALIQNSIEPLTDAKRLIETQEEFNNDINNKAYSVIFEALGKAGKANTILSASLHE